MNKKKISNSSSKFTEIPLEKCRVRLFIFCPHAGHGHIKIEVVPLADNMFYATLNRNKNTPFLKKGNDSKLCTHFFKHPLHKQRLTSFCIKIK